MLAFYFRILMRFTMADRIPVQKLRPVLRLARANQQVTSIIRLPAAILLRLPPCHNLRTPRCMNRDRFHLRPPLYIVKATAHDLLP